MVQIRTTARINSIPKYKKAVEMHEGVILALESMVGPTVKRNIISSYQSGFSRWAPKIDGSPCFLFDTGALSASVHSMIVTGKRQGKKFLVNIQADFPRNKDGTEYIWYHEFGTGRMHRPFLRPGLMNAAVELSTLFSLPSMVFKTVINEPDQFGVKGVEYGSGYGSFNYISLRGMWTILIPPTAPFSQIMLGLGVKSDLGTIIDGSMFTERALGNMTKAMIMGYAGLTPRSARRRARRKLWAGVF